MYQTSTPESSVGIRVQFRKSPDLKDTEGDFREYLAICIALGTFARN